ncbi:alpha/beta fold hydrolase [uncultured Croceitalea sp.]|uniref:alpha/beta hydrolase family protein n=1 Tax=uncultured Croceitalea sp. TaxID=1798908 RepID=UPI0033060629
MKNLLITLCISLFTTFCFSQDLTGKWTGEVKGSKGQIPFVFIIENNNGTYVTTIDIPSKRVLGLKPKATHLKNGELFVDGSNLGIKYQGKYNKDKMHFEGTFTEGANSFPLNLKKGEIKMAKLDKRPQEPVKPYPYVEEEVVFKNESADVSLSGTLTLPKGNGKFPVVILMSGTGPQDRDETNAGHKPFLVLADYLTRNGIAVLRYDDRGFAKSTGNHAASTSEDFVIDAICAVEYIKSRNNIDKKNIGIIGHSEGGSMAPMVANRSKDVSFIVMLAGTGIPGSEFSLMQSKAFRPFPVPDEKVYENAIRQAIKIASSDKKIDEVKSELTAHYGNTIAPILKALVGSDDKVKEIIGKLVEGRTTPHSRYFYNYNPQDELEKIKVPVLSLNGSKDIQVNAKVNQEGIRNALAKSENKDFKVIELPGLNHFFQECETGKMDEYSKIDQTFSPIVLQEISYWITKHIKK